MDLTPARLGAEPVTNDSEPVEVVNPYTGEVIAAVTRCGPVEVDRACALAAEAARRSFPQHARAQVLERAAVAVGERLDELARLIAVESGKPLRTAAVEARRCVDTFTFAAAEARRLSGELLPMEGSASGSGKLGFALRVPIGVVAAITPFNFPLNLVAHKLAPAIAAGCPVVLKPASQTPLTALALVELLVAAGLPEDWVSVLTDGGREAGEALVAHPVPAMITFTGSAEVGWAIAAAAPRKKVALELGSTSPVVVEPDADPELVATKVALAGFAYAGQSCISVQRVLVHDDVHDDLVELLASRVADLVVGDPLDEATDVGPLIRPSEAERVRAWVGEAVAGGGRLVAGGEVVGRGLLQPTVVDAAPPDSDICRKEVFGPVVAVNAYSSFDQALAVANDSPFGLHAGVFTNDLGKALQAVRQLDYGGVLVNEVPTFRADQQPYGGVRDSGSAREGPAYAVRDMTRLKFVSFQ